MKNRGNAVGLHRNVRASAQQGFTLIEIMIVITLLGLMAAFVVQNYMGRLQEGNRKGTKIIMQQIRTALDDYLRTCASYPSSGQGGLDALVNKPGDGCPNYDTNGYLKDRKVPKDAWGREFVYISEDGRKYTLKSLGLDGREGGEGNDKDISTDDADF